MSVIRQFLQKTAVERNASTRIKMKMKKKIDKNANSGLSSSPRTLCNGSLERMVLFLEECVLSMATASYHEASSRLETQYQKLLNSLSKKTREKQEGRSQEDYTYISFQLSKKLLSQTISPNLTETSVHLGYWNQMKQNLIEKTDSFLLQKWESLQSLEKDSHNQHATLCLLYMFCMSSLNWKHESEFSPLSFPTCGEYLMKVGEEMKTRRNENLWNLRQELLANCLCEEAGALPEKSDEPMFWISKDCTVCENCHHKPQRFNKWCSVPCYPKERGERENGKKKRNSQQQEIKTRGRRKVRERNNTDTRRRIKTKTIDFSSSSPPTGVSEQEREQKQKDNDVYQQMLRHRQEEQDERRRILQEKDEKISQLEQFGEKEKRTKKKNNFKCNFVSSSPTLEENLEKESKESKESKKENRKIFIKNSKIKSQNTKIKKEAEFVCVDKSQKPKEEESLQPCISLFGFNFYRIFRSKGEENGTFWVAMDPRIWKKKETSKEKYTSVLSSKRFCLLSSRSKRNGNGIKKLEDMKDLYTLRLKNCDARPIGHGLKLNSLSLSLSSPRDCSAKDWLYLQQSFDRFGYNADQVELVLLGSLLSHKELSQLRHTKEEKEGGFSHLRFMLNFLRKRLKE